MTNNNDKHKTIVRLFGKETCNIELEINSFNDMFNIELEKQYYISNAFLCKFLSTLDYENECIIIHFHGSLLDCYLLYNSEYNKTILIREKYLNCQSSINTLEVTSDIDKVKSFIKYLYNDTTSKSDLISLYNNLNYDTCFKNSTVAML